MAGKFLSKLMNRARIKSGSIIQPNDSLNLAELSKYTQVVTAKEEPGYKGLKTAFNERKAVIITIENDDKSETIISGFISHYDDKFKQLMVNMNSQLKRVGFDDIIDVKIEDTVIPKAGMVESEVTN